MEARVQAIKDQYFQEYKEQSLQNIDGMQAELMRWNAADDTILTMTLDEQSTYADYVTRKLCGEQPEEIVIHSASGMFAELPPGVKLNSCAIGNIALLLKSVKEMEGHQELKDRLEGQYGQYRDTLV
jgi:hypothetical protein